MQRWQCWEITQLEVFVPAHPWKKIMGFLVDEFPFLGAWHLIWPPAMLRCHECYTTWLFMKWMSSGEIDNSRQPIKYSCAMKKTGCLGWPGDDTAQLYGDYNNHYQDPY